MAINVNHTLKQANEYTDEVPNSVELGFELNDNCYYFDILPPETGAPPGDPPPRNRQLYVRSAPPVQPIRSTLAQPEPITPGMVPGTAPGMNVASYGNLPAGADSVSVVSVSNGASSCTRTTEVVSQGSGKPPKVTTNVSGNCGAESDRRPR